MFDVKTELNYTSKFSLNLISGYDINSASNTTIFASESRIGLTFFYSNDLFKSRSNVKVYLALKGMGKFTKHKSIENLKGIL